MERSFYLGCAVWAYKAWVGEFFPAGSRSSDFLKLYSRRLTTVEGNSTFYATPAEETVRRWVAETPEGFRFCPKLPREVSHAGPLEAQIGRTAAFIDRMALLNERLGPFFLQLPPGYGPARLGDLARWLAAWPTGYALAVEVRHPDWYAEPQEAQLMELLERHGVGRVLMDVRPISGDDEPEHNAYLMQALERKPVVPLHPLRSGNMAMVRYIGHPEPARNDALLDEWAERITGWLSEGTQVYFFCHCPDERLSPGLCRTFQRHLERLGAAPPLPWDTAEGGIEQASMF